MQRKALEGSPVQGIRDSWVRSLSPPPSSLPELRNPSPTRNRPFLRGFLTPIFEFPVSADVAAARVDFWPPVSVSKNSVPGGTVSSDTRPFGDLKIRNTKRQKMPFLTGSQLLWVQSERLELPAPFFRSITKSFDSDPAEQTAFDRRSDEIRSEEGE